MTPPDIFSAEFARDPYPHYRAMRDNHPLFFHSGAKAYVLSRYEDVKTAITDPNFSTRSYAAQIEPLLGVTLVQLDGRDHARQRRLLAAPFRADRFETRFAREIGALADTLIARFRDTGCVDLVGAFINAFAVGVLAIVVGLPTAELEHFRTWYSALLRFGLNLKGDPAVTQAGFAACRELQACLRPLVEQSRRSGGAGLLSKLTAAEIDGQFLSDDEILHFAMLLIFAGGETVEKTLATFIRNLVAHPTLLAQVQADRRLVDRALAESLRYTAPTHMVPRRTNMGARVSGGTIPADAEVICFLGAANRDERRFAAPDHFDMYRTDYDVASAFTGAADHLAFGMGRHFCLGAMMARIEVSIAVNRLLDAMRDIRFVDDNPPEDEGLFLRGPTSLMLQFTPRH